MPIDLSAAQSSDVPFACFTVGRAISQSLEEDLLDWLEHDAKWVLAETSFYEQYEIRFHELPLPVQLQPLVSVETIDYLRDTVGGLLGLMLEPFTEITAHRLDAGQTIRIHNDHRPDGEICRFLIQLNRGWSDEQGGFLMLFRGPEPDSLESIVSPQSGSAFGFHISEQSHHAVSKVHGGHRFTMVYSFYGSTLHGRP